MKFNNSNVFDCKPTVSLKIFKKILFNCNKTKKYIKSLANFFLLDTFLKRT